MPARKRTLALSRVCTLLAPGPVLLLCTSRKGAANVTVAGETLELASRMR